MHPDTPAENWIRNPDAHGLFVPADPPASATLLSRYARLAPERLSWSRGCLGLPALTLSLDLDPPPDAFARHFQETLTRWVPAASPTTGPRKPADTPMSVARMIEAETRFVRLCLDALDRWNREPNAIVLWDIDETLIGSGDGVRFVRPSSEATLLYAARHFPRLQNGILSSLAPLWIPAAARFIEQTLAAAGAEVRFEPDARFSFRPALDLLEPIPWDRVRDGLRTAGLPDCDPGHLPLGWPMYATEFTRVLTVGTLRSRGWNAKVIDNDLNACFDPDNPAENRASDQVRSWIRAMLGDACALGPHWWPQDAEEWILQRIAERAP
jgi:hypothetical protein